MDTKTCDNCGNSFEVDLGQTPQQLAEGRKHLIRFCCTKCKNQFHSKEWYKNNREEKIKKTIENKNPFKNSLCNWLREQGRK